MNDLPVRGMLHLLLGGKVSEAIVIKKEVTVLGREDADVVLEDIEVSGQHCQIQILSGNYHLFDLNSTNGTFLNGQKILKCRVVPGDIIRVGNVEFRFALGKEDPAPPRETIRTFDGVEQKVDGMAYSILDLIRAEKVRTAASLRLEIEGHWCDGTREILRLKTREEIVGRLTGVGRFQKDEELSRRHARVFIGEDGHVVVEDLESTNGTFVNEEKLMAPRQLSARDTVRIGKTKFQVRTWTAD